MLIDSAAQADDEFRKGVRKQLLDLRSEFVKLEKSQKKASKFFGDDVKSEA